MPEKYHRHNALKIQIMHALYFSDYPMTTKEIGEAIGVPWKNVSKQMCEYRKKNTRYFRRLKPVKGSQSYRYNITKRGMSYFIKYCYRLREGFDLNLSQKIPRRMPARERILQQRRDDAERRRAVFEATGVYQPEPPKPKIMDIINITKDDLKDFIVIREPRQEIDC